MAAAIATLDDDSEDEEPEIDPSAVGSLPCSPGASPRGSFLLPRHASIDADDDDKSNDLLMPSSPHLLRRALMPLSSVTSGSTAISASVSSARSSPPASLTGSPRSSFGEVFVNDARPQDLPEPGQKLAKIRLLEQRRRSRNRANSAPQHVLFGALRQFRGSLSVDQSHQSRPSLVDDARLRRISSVSPSRSESGLRPRLSVDDSGPLGQGGHYAREGRPRRIRSDSVPTVLKLGENLGDGSKLGGAADHSLLTQAPSSRVTSSLASDSRSASEGADGVLASAATASARTHPTLSISDELSSQITGHRPSSNPRRLLTPVTRMSLSVSDADNSDDEESDGLRAPLQRIISQISIEEAPNESQDDESEDEERQPEKGHAERDAAGRTVDEGANDAFNAAAPTSAQGDRRGRAQRHSRSRSQRHSRSPLSSESDRLEGGPTWHSRSPSPAKVPVAMPRISLNHHGDGVGVGVGITSLGAAQPSSTTASESSLECGGTGTARDAVASFRPRAAGEAVAMPAEPTSAVTAAVNATVVPALPSHVDTQTSRDAAQERAAMLKRQDLSVEGRRLSLERSKKRYSKIGGLQSSTEVPDSVPPDAQA